MPNNVTAAIVRQLPPLTSVRARKWGSATFSGTILEVTFAGEVPTNEFISNLELKGHLICDVNARDHDTLEILTVELSDG